MLNKYIELNEKAKKYLIDELRQIENDKSKLARCYKEIDVLYDNRVLPIIQYLYIYKKNNNVKYFFQGTINNLLVLYMLGLSNVDPIKYDLTYEVFTERYDYSIAVAFVEGKVKSFVEKVNKMQTDFTIYRTTAISDYIDDAYNYEIVLNGEAIDTSDNLIIELSEIRFQKELSRDDVYTYLIKHEVPSKIAVEIMKFVRKGCPKTNCFPDKWNRYKQIMKEYNCDECFIEVCSKVKHLCSKGQEISRSLYRL